MITIIVPVYQDTVYIKSKLMNLFFLKAPTVPVEFMMIHGGAKVDRITFIDTFALPVKIVHTKAAGKTGQINEALKHAHGDIILITDVDTVLSENALVEIEKRFIGGNGTIGVVGLWAIPRNCKIVDRVYWWAANWLRVAEDKFCSCSHVVAPCYAFKRQLFAERIPDDVVADDVYISLKANFDGHKVRYIRNATVDEIRQPRSFREFYRHKTRKGNAVLRELLRFTYRIAEAEGRFKVIFFLRLIQFTILTPTVFLTYPFFRQTSKYRKAK